jgi:lysyl-tRNA synthetase class 2
MSDQNEQTAATPEDENRLIAERRGKLAALRESGNPFPNDFRRSATAGELQREYEQQDKATLESLAWEFAVAGRLIRNRGAFLLIQDGDGQIQLYIDRKGLSAETLEAIKSWDLGDIVCARGPLQRSGKGDLYISMAEARLLTKALRPLPDKYHGLADQELRYRQRYVDLIVNESSRDVFRTRSQIIRYIRELYGRAWLHGGGDAHDAAYSRRCCGKTLCYPSQRAGSDMYLRIAPELYLKRLTVGGFERVYEINRNFRNEGLSTRHNPEFTMLEYYWAYADYRDAMDLTEEMLRGLIRACSAMSR